MNRPTLAEIDLKAFAHNWKVLSSFQDVSRIIPVVKADAYGHGVDPMVLALQEWGVHRVAVALFEEALEVRRAGFRGPVLILGPFASEAIPEAQRQNFIPMVGDKQFLIDLGASGFSGPIHLKWDTGMHRLGLVEADVDWTRSFLQQHPQIRVEALSTHFLKGDDFGKPAGMSEAQLRCFQRIESHFGAVSEKHIFNSDSYLANQKTGRVDRQYGARPGIALYGYTGLGKEWRKQLRPVMTLKTKIVHLTKVKKGATVSYNGTWTAPRDSMVAVLPIGYADGYPRSLSNKGQVFIRGRAVPLVGIVCMDYLMIDVSDISGVSVGDEVELWGRNISLYDLAQAAGTITYELVTALTSRVPRKVLK